MIAFPNAKINLGIRVLRKRGDGFHDLETVFYPVPLCDILEITPIGPDNDPVDSKLLSNSVKFNTGSGYHILWSTSGDPVQGDPQENLCIKAFRLFDALHPVRSSYFVHLHKVIPSGAGLGGGSSDASFLLKLLNEQEGFPFTNKQLAEMSLRLGSDCPFFISNQPSLAFGRGELLQPSKIDLKGYYMILVKPPVHISTPDAFKNVTLSEPLFENSPEKDIPVEEWQRILINSFEPYVFSRNPEVMEIKNRLLAAGATYASMSGSGSSVFGIFKKPVSIDFSGKGYFIFDSQL